MCRLKIFFYNLTKKFNSAVPLQIYFRSMKGPSLDGIKYIFALNTMIIYIYIHTHTYFC